MRVVEITGPPGSGKSTVVGVVRECLESHNITTCAAGDLILHSGKYPFDRSLWRGLVARLPGPLYRKCLRGMNNYLHLKHEARLQFLLQHLPMFEELQTILTSTESQDQERQRAFKVLLNSGGLFQMAADAPDEDAVFLLDEGFSHRAISLFVDRQGSPIEDSTMIEDYLMRVPPCQAVISVKADPAACARRLQGRGLTKRLDGASEREVDSYIFRACEVIDVATATLNQLGVLVFEIHNTDEPFVKSKIASQLGPFVKAFAQVHSCPDRKYSTSASIAAANASPVPRNS